MNRSAMNQDSPRMGPGRTSRGLALLLLAACAIVATDTLAESKPQSAEFQRLVGGLGCGPSVELETCAHDVDPRLGACAWDVGPLPGGGCYCPRHGMSIFYVRSDLDEYLPRSR